MADLPTANNTAPFDFNAFLSQQNTLPSGPAAKTLVQHAGTRLPTPVNANHLKTTYNINSSPVDPPQPSNTTPIAHYNSHEPGFPFSGATIAVNDQYICYVVKGGLIRVIDRANASRTLLRGHQPNTATGIPSNHSKGAPVQVVFDLAFFNSTSDVLASVGGLGDAGNGIIVWRIYNASVSNNGAQTIEIMQEKMLQINFPGNRLVWHPFTPNMFLILRASLVEPHSVHEAVQVETTKLLTSPHEEGHALCNAVSQGNEDGTQPLFGARLRGHKGALTDICWSKDASHALTSSTDGTVRIWDLKAGSHEVANDGMLLVRCLFRLSSFGGEQVTRVFFLPDNSAVGNKPLLSSFVTASRDNAEVTLWSSVTEQEGVPSKVQTFSFKDPEESNQMRLNVTLCTGVKKAGVTSSFLIFGDKDRGSIYALHLAIPGLDAPMGGFDFITPLRILNPILSWSAMVSLVDPNDCLDGDELDSKSGSSAIGEGSEMCLYCVQDKAVQLLKLRYGLCFPSFAPQIPVSTGVFAAEVSGDNEDDADEGEQYDLDEEEDVSSPSDEEEDVTPNVVTPSASALPSPSPDAMPSVSSDQSGQTMGGFSNWLGNIISGSATEATPEPVVSAEVAVDVKESNGSAKSAPLLPKAVKIEEKPKSQFLSPNELLRKRGDDVVAPVPTKEMPSDLVVELPKSRHKADTIPASQPKRSKSSKKQSKSRESTPPPPVKIAILKREEKVPAVAAENSVSVQKDNSSSAQSARLNADLKAAIFFMLEASSKKRDAVILSEIQKTIKSEISGSVIPALGKVVTQSIEQSVAKPLQVALSKNAKESSKVRTKEVIEAVSSSIKEPVTDAFHKSMRNVMIPAYETATNQMFSQISESLDTGLATKQADDTTKMIESMASLMQTMASSIDSLTREVAELRSSIADSTTNGSAVAAEDTDIKSIIMQQLRAKNYEAAFTSALSSNSADITVFTCKNADIGVILDEDSTQVSQAILLCLMQQLSAALMDPDNTDPATEMEWLQEIAVVLDPNDNSIRAHASSILKQAGKNVSAKVAVGDVSRIHKRQLQTLLQVLRGLASS